MGISMKPYQFYEMFVLGNYSDFKDQPDCIRRAFNAVVSASHMADHYFNYYKDKDIAKVNDCIHIGNYVEYVSKQTNGIFRDIRSIANAYKHLYTKTDPRSSISSAGTIEVIALGGAQKLIHIFRGLMV